MSQQSHNREITYLPKVQRMMYEICFLFLFSNYRLVKQYKDYQIYRSEALCMSIMKTFTSQYSEDKWSKKFPRMNSVLSLFCKPLFLLCSSLVSSCLKDLQDFVAQLWTSGPGLRSLSRFHQHLRLRYFDIWYRWK